MKKETLNKKINTFKRIVQVVKVDKQLREDIKEWIKK